jgi:hypothetical protein
MQRSTRFQRATVSGLVLSLLLTMSATGMAASQEKSLYERVGGYNALAAVVDDFIVRLVSDKQFEKFFIGQSNDSKKQIRQHILDQFCAATGGPCVYTGREMKTSHSGFGYHQRRVGRRRETPRSITRQVQSTREREGRDTRVRHQSQERHRRETMTTQMLRSVFVNTQTQIADLE